MNLTDYHAKYFAHELTKRCPPDSMEKLAGAVASAQVDLNPHQVDAALFAFQSPLSKGALLADEVGLGKTIEAGLVLSQKWAERKRRILVITPSNLRKQWYQELTEKFFLPCRLLEAKSYNAAIKQGQFRPFEATEIVICSYQFAKSKAADIHAHPWDLVVIDEAHRLRNVYKPQNVIANTLKMALAGKDKLLLTATPLQNSLLELFGLVSFIDEHTFGDLKSFREQFANVNQEQVFQTLKARLKPICHRTLRRQVTSYIPYTKRLPLVEEFTPEESEDRLYLLVSDYLQRDNLQALPASQRSLMTLVLRKLLASSTFAIAGALTTISNRLKAKLRKQAPAESLPTESLQDELDQDYEALDETAEAWTEDEPVEFLTESDRKALEQEIADLDAFAALASSIDHNAKGKALLKALGIAFAKARESGAEQKAIIFTESRRTQSYLLRLLADSPFAQGIVLFNGSNTDDRSKLIYNEWFARHQGSDRVTGSRSADMRSALVDYFREQGRIMIATEAGAEGKVTLLEPLIGKSGWLTLSLFSVESLDQAEDHLIIAAETDEGQILEEEVAARLLTLPGTCPPLPLGEGPGVRESVLHSQIQQRQATIQRNISERNARFFEAEADKLDGWADDLKMGLEREIKELDRQIKEARRTATTALTLEEKLVGQKQIKALEAQRNQKRRTLFDAQDQVGKQRDELIEKIEGKLIQQSRTERLFQLHWRLN